MNTRGAFQPQPFSDSVFHLSFKLHLFPIGNIPSISRGGKNFACCAEGVSELTSVVKIRVLCIKKKLSGKTSFSKMYWLLFFPSSSLLQLATWVKSQLH